MAADGAAATAAPWEASAIAAAAAAAAAAGEGAAPPAAAASAPPLPPWMRDPGFLNPLLAAYDQRVRSLEEDAAAKAEAVRAIEGQVRIWTGPPGRRWPAGQPRRRAAGCDPAGSLLGCLLMV
jgi:hypothetical protein